MENFLFLLAPSIRHAHVPSTLEQNLVRQNLCFDNLFLSHTSYPIIQYHWTLREEKPCINISKITEQQRQIVVLYIRAVKRYLYLKTSSADGRSRIGWQQITMVDDDKIVYQYENRSKVLDKNTRDLLDIEEHDLKLQDVMLIAVQLLWDVLIYKMGNKCEYDGDDVGDTNKLVQRIQSNDPTLTSLALKIAQVPSRGQSVPFFCDFTQLSMQQTTDALQTNQTIRSVSCSYEQKSARRIPFPIQASEIYHNAEAEHSDHYNNASIISYNREAKLQERRFFEACICLPQLESISLTGGHRWKISHLITILNTAKQLKKLVVQDILVKRRSELDGLKRIFIGSTRRNYRPLLLESIELTIEDQTGDEYENWSNAMIESSVFDLTLQHLIYAPNINTINLSKSVLSRLHLRKNHDVSATTLMKMASCESLRKLILSDVSVEQGGVEAMCKSLIHHNGHLSNLEFYGVAFTQSVGETDWNSMFRLIKQDPTIQIRASSLIYRERPNECNSQDDGVFGSPFVQSPHEDCSFSLRDEEGASQYFRNRCLGVRYMLQEVGFFRMIRSKQKTNGSEWIDAMARVRHDSMALFYILRENPALCDLV